MKITPQGEIVGGDSGHPGTVLFALAKALFGVDANGHVTIPDDLTAAPTSFTSASFVAEVNLKT
jgi:hypothetical protein